MIEIANMRFDASVERRDGEVGTLINGIKCTDDIVAGIRDAKELKEITISLDGKESVLSLYNLIEWKSIENVGSGILFKWQTYRTTDIEQIKQDNEDLTQALLELAEIVGGDANG